MNKIRFMTLEEIGQEREGRARGLKENGRLRMERLARETTAAETWVCCHIRSCKWSGKKTDLREVRGKIGKHECLKAACPQCGGLEFYVRKTNESQIPE